MRRVAMFYIFTKLLYMLNSKILIYISAFNLLQHVFWFKCVKKTCTDM